MDQEAVSGHLDVLVIDNQDLVREAITSRLAQEKSIKRVRAAARVEAADSGGDPDVIVVEPHAPGAAGDSHRIVAQLKERYSRAQILVLTHTESALDIQECLTAGARGYLCKRAGGWDLVDALQRVAQGEEYLQPSLGALLARKAQEAGTPAGASLTETERDVLRTLALGYTNAEASRILSFGVRTVEGYRSRIMKKLGLSSRAELVRAAVDMGLLSGLEPGPQQSSQIAPR